MSEKYVIISCIILNVKFVYCRASVVSGKYSVGQM